MRSKKEILEYYEEAKASYELAEKDMDVPEGDFNELKAEYNLLAWVLEL